VPLLVVDNQTEVGNLGTGALALVDKFHNSFIVRWPAGATNLGSDYITVVSRNRTPAEVVTVWPVCEKRTMSDKVIIKSWWVDWLTIALEQVTKGSYQKQPTSAIVSTLGPVPKFWG
jgi:hypothetical protein